MSYLAAFLYVVFVLLICCKIHSMFLSFDRMHSEEEEDFSLLKDNHKDLPSNVISLQPYNVFKELLIEFLEVEKKTDMQTYAVTRSRVLRKAKRLLDME